jgi:murein DD-endopeptidase MepM/ murein hydrolase activator NlpD
VLHDKEVEQGKWVREVDAQKREVAVKAEEAHGLLAKANTDRAEAERQLQQLEEDSREIAAMIGRVQRGEEGARYTGHWSGSLLRPVGGRVTCGFGPRIHPITHRSSFHNGVDLGASYGTPIHAADRGLVVHAGWWGAYGQAVIIDHGSGLSTMYGHMSSIAVGDGQTVRRGQIIGYVGSTGWSTGPHLHFTVFKNGEAVNPLGF